MSVRIKIDLSYDGTAFSGWAAQPGRRTVEDVLAQGLERVLRLGEPPRLTVAGRTDAGVHARGQVAHADVPADAWAAVAGAGESSQAGGSADSSSQEGGAESGPEGSGENSAEGRTKSGGEGGAENRVRRRLARALPPDVRVRCVELAPAGFDARFSALWRRYSYRICDDPAAADPLRRQDTLWHPRRLDLAAMNAAAAGLLGTRDFAAFCRRREGATTVRALRRLDWQRDAEGVAVGTVVADAFCHNMVRALVGALLPVGEGSRPPDWPSAVLAAAVRDPAVRVVPPNGLCLEEVRYPEPGELAGRAALTRRVRG